MKKVKIIQELPCFRTCLPILMSQLNHSFPHWRFLCGTCERAQVRISQLEGYYKTSLIRCGEKAAGVRFRPYHPHMIGSSPATTRHLTWRRPAVPPDPNTLVSQSTLVEASLNANIPPWSQLNHIFPHWQGGVKRLPAALHIKSHIGKNVTIDPHIFPTAVPPSLFCSWSPHFKVSYHCLSP